MIVHVIGLHRVHNRSSYGKNKDIGICMLTIKNLCRCIQALP